MSNSKEMQHTLAIADESTAIIKDSVQYKTHKHSRLHACMCAAVAAERLRNDQ